jgi:hypothetical protein
MQFQKGQPLPLQLFDMHGEAEEARWSQATCGASKKARRSGKPKKGGRQLAKPTRRVTGKTTIEIDSVKFNVDLHKQLFAEYGLTWPPPPLAMGGSDREKQVIYFCEQVLPRVCPASCQSIIIDSSQQIHRVPQGFDMTPCLTPAASLFAVCRKPCSEGWLTSHKLCAPVHLHSQGMHWSEAPAINDFHQRISATLQEMHFVAQCSVS